MIASAFVRLMPPPSLADRSEDQQRSRRVERLVSAHLGAVWRTARDLGVPARDVEDVAQDVMLVVVRRLENIEPGRERAFLLATTTRVVSNWRRGKRRKPADLSDSMDEVSTLGPRSSVSNPAREAEQRQQLVFVERVLEAMTEPQREAFVLFELEQLSGKEIAEQLGLSEAVVFARVRRARTVFHRLYERLQPCGPDGEEDPKS